MENFVKVERFNLSELLSKYSKTQLKSEEATVVVIMVGGDKDQQLLRNFCWQHPAETGDWG